MPDFTIIAGPNGAGKSSFSRLLSTPGSLIFDADKVKAIKEKQYPDLPGESIGMMVDSAYWEAEEITIGEKKDLTVETNLRDDFLINRAIYFKGKGYTVNLIFMLLPDLKTSMDRVNLRVDQKGHFVDIESIKYNFEYSLKMLKQHFQKFDSLYLFDSSLNNNLSIPDTLLIVKNNYVKFINSNPPSWAKPVLDEIIQKLTTN
jgi:predicted ABC-type ATPase